MDGTPRQHLGETRIRGDGAHVFVLRHEPCEGAVKELHLRDGFCGAETGVFCGRFETRGALEGEVWGRGRRHCFLGREKGA